LKNICLKANDESKPVGEVISVRLLIWARWPPVPATRTAYTCFTKKNEKL